jgi:hypothetical protein
MPAPPPVPRIREHFKMQFKNLNRFRTGGTSTKMQLSVPLPRTPDGRVYRYSPNEHAHPRHFVLGEAKQGFVISDAARTRMKLEPQSKQTVCPYSGTVADDSDFTHPDDVKAARKIVEHAAVADVKAAFSRMFEGFNRRQSSNSSFQIKASVTSPSNPKPRFGRRDLLRELLCDHCGRDYGVYAIALFCPDCGAPNLRLHFAREADLVRMQVNLAEAQGEDGQELAYRLLGNAHEDVLTAFEAMLKTVYLYGVAQPGSEAAPVKPVKNDFQNIEFAQRRFADLEIDPFDALDADELSELKLNIQKRHIIGHNLGVIDAKFAEHADDARLGETVRLVGDDIRRFARLSQCVIDRLDTWLGGAPAPEISQARDEPKLNDQQTPRMAAEREVKLLDSCSNLGRLAQHVGKWIAEQSKDGLSLPVSGQTIEAAFPGTPHSNLAEAIAELEADGYLTTTQFLGPYLPHVRPTLDLYAAFDLIVIGSNPVDDALVLTTMVLLGPDGVRVQELHTRTGWPLRRFNPAVGLVIAQIDEGRVSKAITPEYPTLHFQLAAADRVALRRYAEQLKS